MPIQETAVSPKSIWAGRILSWLLLLFLLFDGVTKVMQVAAVRDAQAGLGYPASSTMGIGVVLLVCAALYAFPRTSILGAILLTAYLGGATASQFRIGGPYFFPVVFGVLIWGALFLSDSRLRTLISLRLRT